MVLAVSGIYYTKTGITLKSDQIFLNSKKFFRGSRQEGFRDGIRLHFHASIDYRDQIETRNWNEIDNAGSIMIAVMPAKREYSVIASKRSIIIFLQLFACLRGQVYIFIVPFWNRGINQRF